MKKTAASKRLLLSVERVRSLQSSELNRVAGGVCNGDSASGGDGGGGGGGTATASGCGDCTAATYQNGTITHPCQYSGRGN